MKVQKLCLYNIEWQKLRVTLSFTNVVTVSESLDKLDDYMNEPEAAGDTRSNKLWRIVNLLNATVMGLRGQIAIAKKSNNTARIDEVEQLIHLIQLYREPFAEEFRHDKNFLWDLVIEKANLRKTPTPILRLVYDSLTKRKSFATNYKKMPVDKTRPELLTYITMLADELDERGVVV